MGEQVFDQTDPSTPGFYFWRETALSEKIALEVDFHPVQTSTLCLIDTTEQVTIPYVRATWPQSEWVGPIIGNGVNPDMEVFQVADIAARDAIADPKEGFIAIVADSDGNGTPATYTYDEEATPSPAWIEVPAAPAFDGDVPVFHYAGDAIPPPVPAGAPSVYRLVQTTTAGDILRWFEDGT